ncbi:MAG: signal peptidase II [Cyanobacteriota bacterium]|jgi:signal peptidase II
MFKLNPLFWRVALVGVVADQVSKEIIVLSLQTVGASQPLWPGVFHLTYVLNTGAAFSLFRDGVDWLKWLSLGVSAGLTVLALKVKLNRLEQAGYGFILAGAVGNGIDRFRLGHVVDFLDARFLNFPIFNLADICINLGILALLWANLPELGFGAKSR